MMTRLLSRPHRAIAPPDAIAATTLPATPVTEPAPTTRGHGPLTKQLRRSIRGFLRQERIITLATYSLIPLILLTFTLAFGINYLRGVTSAASSTRVSANSIIPSSTTGTAPTTAATRAPGAMTPSPTAATSVTATVTASPQSATATPLPLTPTLAPTATVIPQIVLAIDAGSSVSSGDYQADIDYSGGTKSPQTTHAIDTSLAGTAVPVSVYQNARVGTTFSYKITQLMPNVRYTVQLDFAEISTGITGTGQRQFNVAINMQTVLTNFDIVGMAGAVDKAITRSFATTADAAGQVSIVFTGIVNQAAVNGIAIATDPQA